MPEFDESFVFKFRISFSHGVVADDEFSCECAYSGQCIAVLQNTCFDRVADLLHELQVKGLARRRIEFEDHRQVYH